MRKRRILALLALLATILVAIATTDLLLLLRPAQVEAFVRAGLDQVFARPWRLREVRFSLRDGIVVRGLEVVGVRDEPDLSLAELSLAVDWRSLSLHAIRVKGLAARLFVDAQGRFSASDLLRPEFVERVTRPSGPESKLPHIALAIEDASLHFEDAHYGPDLIHVVDVPGLDLDVSLDPERGVDLHGAVRMAFAKSITFEVRVQPEGPEVEGKLSVRKVAVSMANLRSVLPPAPRRIFELINPWGLGDGDFTFSFRDGKLDYGGDVNVLDGNIKCKLFPYEGRGAVGKLRLAPNHLQFLGVHAQKEGGTYGMDGDVWFYGKDRDDRIDLHFWAKEFPLDRELTEAFPHPADEIVGGFSPVGRADGLVHVFGFTKPEDQPDDIHFAVEAALSRGTLHFDKVPVPIVDVSTKIHVRGDPTEGSGVMDVHFDLDGLTGRAEGGAITAGGSASPHDIAIVVDGKALEISPAVRASLPSVGQTVYDVVRPAGPLDLRVEVTGERDPDGGLSPTFRAILTPAPGLTLTWRELPLELSATGGEVEITPRGATIDRIAARFEHAEAGAAPLTVTVSGRVGSSDDGSPIALDIGIENMTLDDPLRHALRGAPHDWIDEAGVEQARVARATVTARKAPFQDSVVVTGTADLDGVRARPRAAPYPIEVAAATVTFTPDALDIVSLRGHAGDGVLRASGLVSLREDVPSTAGATIVGLTIDHRVRDAAGKPGASLFEQVDLRGKADAAVSLQGGGARIRPTVEAHLRDAAARLHVFPFEATHIDATLGYDGQRITIDALTGVLGEASLSARGEIGPLGAGMPAAGPAGRATIELQHLPLDARLRDALPPSLRDVFAQADLMGRVTLTANLLYDPSERAPVLHHAAVVHLDGGHLDAGILLRDMKGVLNIEGATPLGAPDRTRIRGSIAGMEAKWLGQTISGVTGRLRYGDGLFELREVRGSVIDGALRTDFYRFIDSPNIFGGEASLVGGRIERWVTDSKDKRDVSGRMDVRFDFLGGGVLDGKNESSGFHADGRVDLIEANLAELPPVAGIFNVLSAELPSSSPIFDDAHVLLRMDGARTIFDEVRLSCSAISFTGQGDMKDGTLDIHLTPELGRSLVDSIPLIGDLWRFFKGQIVQVDVRGPVAEPKITPVFLKSLWNPFKWIFGGSDDTGPKSKKRMEE